MNKSYVLLLINEKLIMTIVESTYYFMFNKLHNYVY